MAGEINVVVRLSHGGSQPHLMRHGGWTVHDNGTLTVHDGNKYPKASYPAGHWVEVKYG